MNFWNKLKPQGQQDPRMAQDQRRSQPAQLQPRATQSFYGSQGGRPPQTQNLFQRPTQPMNLGGRQPMTLQRPQQPQPQQVTQAQQPSRQLQGNFAGMLSDEDEKDVKDDDVDKKIQDFMDRLSCNEYTYKDPSMEGAAEGPQFGIMAQDLEKSEVGRTLVEEDQDGNKRVSPRISLVNAAMSANINERLKKLEKGKKK